MVMTIKRACVRKKITDLTKPQIYAINQVLPFINFKYIIILLFKSPFTYFLFFLITYCTKFAIGIKLYCVRYCNLTTNMLLLIDSESLCCINYGKHKPPYSWENLGKSFTLLIFLTRHRC